MNEIGRELGQRIQAGRRGEGWTQEDLAHHAGLESSYLNQLENGRRNPSQATLYKVAAALGWRQRTLFRADSEKLVYETPLLDSPFKQHRPRQAVPGQQPDPAHQEDPPRRVKVTSEQVSRPPPDRARVGRARRGRADAKPELCVGEVRVEAAG